jgi:hypothetical protein
MLFAGVVELLSYGAVKKHRIHETKLKTKRTGGEPLSVAPLPSMDTTIFTTMMKME